jgi:outer membrane protein OmpA-like peptidoglycan-associated protein
MCTTLIEEEEPAPVATERPAASMSQVNIFFGNESVSISSEQASKLNSYADWLKANPDVSINISGFSSRGTGSPSQNQRLAEERASAVKAYLLSRGIAESRIASVIANGDRIQPFAENELNDVVICTTR